MRECSGAVLEALDQLEGLWRRQSDALARVRMPGSRLQGLAIVRDQGSQPAELSMRLPQDRCSQTPTRTGARHWRRRAQQLCGDLGKIVVGMLKRTTAYVGRVKHVNGCHVDMPESIL